MQLKYVASKYHRSEINFFPNAKYPSHVINFQTVIVSSGEVQYHSARAQQDEQLSLALISMTLNQPHIQNLPLPVALNISPPTFSQDTLTNKAGI